MPKLENKLYFVEEEYADIYTLPEVNCPEPNSIVVLGDAHGRFIKPMWESLKYCVISNITPAQYSVLVDIQQANGDELSKEDLTLFKKILNGIVVNPMLKIISTGNLLAARADADEFNYDKYRGGNDYLNLKFLEILSKANIILGICYSGHDTEVIDRYERGLSFSELRWEPKYHYVFNSLLQLQKLIDRNLVDRATEIGPLIENHYLPYLNMLIYCRGLLITHAPAGLKQVERLAKQLNVSYPYNTQSQEFSTWDENGHLLNKTVLAINTIFRKYTAAGITHTLYDYYHPDYNNNMFDILPHNRKREGLERRLWLHQINAHDKENEHLDPPNVFTLHSYLGKGRCPEDTCTGINKVIVLNPERQEAQQLDAHSNHHELLDSIFDIYFNMIIAAGIAFFMAVALGLFGKFLEQHTRFEQKQINQIKFGISAILIAYSLWIMESEKVPPVILSLFVRYITQALLSYNTLGDNEHVHVVTTTTATSMALAASNSNTWTSFFGKTIAQTSSSLSAYYGYSLGNGLVYDAPGQTKFVKEKVPSEEKAPPSSLSLRSPST